MLTIRGERVNLAMGSILNMSSNVKPSIWRKFLKTHFAGRLLTTQQLSFLISNILCKIVVNDVLNTQSQNILNNIFEDKRGQSQK